MWRTPKAVIRTYIRAVYTYAIRYGTYNLRTTRTYLEPYQDRIQLQLSDAREFQAAIVEGLAR